MRAEPSLPRSSLVLASTLLLALGLLDVAGETAEPAALSYDCGVQSLYCLLRLEGRSTELPRVKANLPPLRPEGYSMKELRDSALACRLNLIGVRLEKSERAIDRPMLTLLKREGHGHFVVIRPVGHTGKLVQLIDPNRTPIVLDKADLFDSPEWTGLALIPTHPNWPVRILSFIAMALLAFAVLRVFLRLRLRNTDLIPGNIIQS